MREIRDILAECMRRERLGSIRPLWEDWVRFDDAACEQVRLRADHITRLLAENGVALVRVGDDAFSCQPPTSAVIWRYHAASSKSERLVRKGAGEAWEVVATADGKESVLLRFTLTDLHIEANRVLTGDPSAAELKGLMTRLAAGLEVYRMDAAAMEPAP